MPSSVIDSGSASVASLTSSTASVSSMRRNSRKSQPCRSCSWQDASPGVVLKFASTCDSIMLLPNNLSRTDCTRFAQKLAEQRLQKHPQQVPRMFRSQSITSIEGDHTPLVVQRSLRPRSFSISGGEMVPDADMMMMATSAFFYRNNHHHHSSNRQQQQQQQQSHHRQHQHGEIPSSQGSNISQESFDEIDIGSADDDSLGGNGNEMMTKASNRHSSYHHSSSNSNSKKRRFNAVGSSLSHLVPNKLLMRVSRRISSHSAAEGCECTSCHQTVTPYWRDGWSEDVMLCNACGLRFQKFAQRCHSCMYIPRKEDGVEDTCPQCNAAWID